MNLLLDTYIAIWALNDDPALSEKARELILDPDNTIYYSTVSVWEVLLKHARRPDNIPFIEADFSEGCREAGFVPLGLADKHILAVHTLSRPDSPDLLFSYEILSLFCFLLNRRRVLPSITPLAAITATQ